jgi:hypothetical protein
MPAAPADDRRLRRTRSTTFTSQRSPVSGPTVPMTNHAVPLAGDQDLPAEVKTPKGTAAALNNHNSTNQNANNNKRASQLGPPAIIRRVSAPQRPVLPSRPSAPINTPASVESSTADSPRIIRKADNLMEGSPQQPNGTTRPRGLTVTPNRPHSMFLPSPQADMRSLDSANDFGSQHFESQSLRAGAPQASPLPMPSAYTFTNSVPWSSRGSLHSMSSGSPEKVPNGALQLMADPNLPPSASASVWGDGQTVTSFGMETEILENEDIDEDLVQAIDAVQVAHTRKVTHYKRLLEQAQTSSASQLHAQQAELKLLRVTLDNERSKAHQNELARDRDRLSQAIHIV